MIEKVAFVPAGSTIVLYVAFLNEAHGSSNRPDVRKAATCHRRQFEPGHTRQVEVRKQDVQTSSRISATAASPLAIVLTGYPGSLTACSRPPWSRRHFRR